MLRNARHEAFAQGVAEGKSSRAAYMAVFSKCKKDVAADASATKLLSRPEVRARIDELIVVAAEKAAAIAEVSKTREGMRVKLHDKVGALEKLGRHLAMFKGKVEVAGAGGGPVQVDMPVPELMRRLAFLLTKPKAEGNS
jgi:hypothetical protein